MLGLLATNPKSSRPAVRLSLVMAAATAFLMTAACSTATVAQADTLAAAAPQGQTGELTISLIAIAQPRGALMVALFNTQAGYENGPPLRGLQVPVNAATATVSVAGLAPGDYAIKLYHDVNGDGQMNTNPFGLPTEPYAFSNNAKGRFGPAVWADAKFTVKAGANTHIIAVAQ